MSKEKPKPGFSKKMAGKPANKAKQSYHEYPYFNAIGLGIVMLLGIIIYSNSFACTFQFDDYNSFVDNMKKGALTDAKAMWDYNHARFIPYLTFVFNYQSGNLNVWGFHFVNLLIHLLNSLLVWWLTRLFLSTPNLKDSPLLRHKDLIALFAALLFVSHPLATQSVTYIIQRMASLVTFFYFLTVALYIKARLSPKSSAMRYPLYVFAGVAAVMAMLSKENSMTLPFVILLVEVFFFTTKRLSINFKDYRVLLVGFGIVGFVFFVIKFLTYNAFQPLAPDFKNNFKTITSIDYLLTQFSVIVKYIQLLLLPINQNIDYDYPVSSGFFELRTLLSFLFLTFLIVLAGFLYKKHRLLSFGIAWFFITLSIESSIIPISDMIFEHRTYLPSLGYYIILSSCIFLFLWDQYKGIALSVMGILIVTNSYLVFERNKVWKDEISLWSDAINKSPNKARPYFNRGVIYVQEKNRQLAFEDFNKAIELSPKWEQPFNMRGNIFLKQNRLDQALSDYSQAIKLKPDYATAYCNRGNVFFNEKNYESSIKDYSKAIKLKSDFAEAYLNRGAARINIGKTDSACLDFQKAFGLGYQPAKDLLNQYCH